METDNRDTYKDREQEREMNKDIIAIFSLGLLIFLENDWETSKICADKNKQVDNWRER